MNDLAEMYAAIENELRRQIDRYNKHRTNQFHEMLSYHMGWSGEGAGPEATGKRIRPLLLLLTMAACGGNWESALPLAAAVELIHNFSLVHDDIQDKSEKRRGRPTVWAKWGAPMAINVGDALFVSANLSALDLSNNVSAETKIKVAEILQSTCLELTVGQYLDMSYETRLDLGPEDYWPMVTGKTASLLAASCHLGAILGQADTATQDAFKSFGHYLGLAYQLQDDILGIWGNEAITGKSATSDLAEGKKSLPVLVGLSKNGKFAEQWKKGPIPPAEATGAAALLASESAYEYTHEAAKQMTDLALLSLREANPVGSHGDTLTELAFRLLRREQ